MRWLLKRLEIHSNAYYNYMKHRKENYYATKQLIFDEIRNIYHENNGVVGYRMMKVYLERKGIKLLWSREIGTERASNFQKISD